MPGATDSNDVKGVKPAGSVAQKSTQPAPMGQPQSESSRFAPNTPGPETKRAPPVENVADSGGLRFVNRSGKTVRIISETRGGDGEWIRDTQISLVDADMTTLEIAEDRRVVIDAV